MFTLTYFPAIFNGEQVKNGKANCFALPFFACEPLTRHFVI